MALIEKLKDAKVSKDKRPLYSLVTWILKKDNMTLQSLQNRINLFTNVNKGYYQEYRKSHQNYDKRNRKQCKKRMRTNDHVEKQRIIQRKISVVYKLYHEGKLSKKSTRLANKKVKEIR